MTAEEQKQRRDYAIVAFNITMMVCMGVLLGLVKMKGIVTPILIAVPLAALAAGVTWKLKSR